MNPNHDPLFYCEHIYDCIETIERHIIGVSQKDFLSNRLIQDAVVTNFADMGEAAKRIGTDFKTAHPEIPWKSITAHRDVLVHNYMGRDYQEIWNTIENDLPPLHSKFKKLLAR